MVQKTASLVHVLVFVGIGVLLGITMMVLQLVLSPQSHIKRVLMYLNWPVNFTIDWWAHTFHNGNTDQLMPQGMVLWGVYWLVLGTVVGLAGYNLWGRKEDGKS